jgi:sulfur oxidation c-type cytochrome SoxX
MSFLSPQFFKHSAITVAVCLIGAIAGSYVLTTLRFSKSGDSVDIADQHLIEQGQRVAQAADCVACHTVPGAAPFSGGLAMPTPMGTIYSTNITPDEATGIGRYDFADFERALRHGVRKDGAALYPAMPYVSYVALTNEDTQALYAYFKSAVKAVDQPNHATQIPWPMNMRWPLAWWQAMFAPNRAFVAPEQADAKLTRGAYLVEVAGHCGTCHTPRGIALNEKTLSNDASAQYLSGSALAGWYAKSLRQEATGLGDWQKQDIVQFLKTGRNDHTAAFGSMAEVVEHSSQHFSDDDIAAIAAYLSTLKAREGQASTSPKASDTTTAQLYDSAIDSAGAHGYVAHCAACHRLNGQGTPRLFPALAANALVQTDDPSSLIQITLSGGAMVKTQADATRPSMPDLSKLGDQSVAEILTFVRTSWGNTGTAVNAQQVAAIRKLIANKPLNVEVSHNEDTVKDTTKGKELALDRAKGNCLACHTLKGGDAPSSVGRELVDIKRKFPNRDDLIEILTNEPMRNAVAPMPPFGRNRVLTPQEIEQIVDFLYTL